MGSKYSGTATHAMVAAVRQARSLVRVTAVLPVGGGVFSAAHGHVQPLRRRKTHRIISSINTLLSSLSYLYFTPVFSAAMRC